MPPILPKRDHGDDRHQNRSRADQDQRLLHDLCWHQRRLLYWGRGGLLLFLLFLLLFRFIGGRRFLPSFLTLGGFDRPYLRSVFGYWQKFGPLQRLSARGRRRRSGLGGVGSRLGRLGRGLGAGDKLGRGVGSRLGRLGRGLGAGDKLGCGVAGLFQLIGACRGRERRFEALRRRLWRERRFEALRRRLWRDRRFEVL